MTGPGGKLYEVKVMRERCGAGLGGGWVAGLLVVAGVAAGAQTLQVPAAAPPMPIGTYIAQSWGTLSRSMSECKSVMDLKVTTAPILYLPVDVAVPAAVTGMEAECAVEVRRLPRVVRRLGDIKPGEIPAEGLLYLPNRYVVPGGRFNEMYGWDSYFILLGLVHDGQVALAKGMVENFFFEIEHYGAVLNANRTYFFTRSQPPFLTSMIRAVYEAPGAGLDGKWLARAYGLAERDYGLWVSPVHRAGGTGLARYRDLGEGPVPEMADDSTYYPDVIRWLEAHASEHPEYLVADSKDAAVVARTSCDAKASKVCAGAVVDGERLSAGFYRGDRAMRESGFDTTFRFGPFSGSTDAFAPVCLNALLFRYEEDMAGFASVLKRPGEAAIWRRRAVARGAAMDKYLWNADAGMYFDYDFMLRRHSGYAFVTAFYPLWAGAASKAQAAAVEGHLGEFERGGGLAESATVSGVQWDAPYGWAPTTWLAVSGLERYGFAGDARRIAGKFSRTVGENYGRDGTIREKYDVGSGSDEVAVSAGYKANVVGFGWTNGVWLMLQGVLGR